MVQACILVRSERGKYSEVASAMRKFKGVNDVFTVLGRYDVVVDLEAPDMVTLGEMVIRIGKLSGVIFTETLVEI